MDEDKNIVETKKESLITDEGGDFFVQELEIERYESFIPHPDIIKGLGEVDPTFPERVMKMTEDNNRNEIILERRGQIFIFILVLVLIGAGIVFAIRGYIELAIPAFIVGAAHIITTAIQNLRK